MWPKLLLMELNEIKEENFIEPRVELQPGDEEIGKMAEDQIKLYTFAENLERAGAEYLLKVRYSTDETERFEAIKKVAELKQKSETLREIMWICIKDHFELWGRESIGIRKGFRVVVSAPKPPNFIDFLRDMNL